MALKPATTVGELIDQLRCFDENDAVAIQYVLTPEVFRIVGVAPSKYDEHTVLVVYETPPD